METLSVRARNAITELITVQEWLKSLALEYQTTSAQLPDVPPKIIEALDLLVALDDGLDTIPDGGTETIRATLYRASRDI